MKITVKDEIEVLYELIDRHQTISFDVYDTALLRNVINPTDLLDIVQRKIQERRVGNIDNFKQQRIKAEESARLTSPKEDITLEEIYKQLSVLTKSVDIQIVKEIELETEREFTIANPVIKKAYEYAFSKGKPLFFISDMYLPRSFIEELLANLGYNKFILYVSNEVEKCKGTGGLYSYIAELNNLTKDGWLHIGDNYVSDYEAAINLGISAYHYRSLRERALVKNSYTLEYSIIKALQINIVETSEELDYWEKFGINTVSSVLWGFTNWLIENIKEKGQDNLFFLSRDGYLPYLIYEKLNGVISHLPPARYIQASRRVYQFPNILNMKRQDALDLLTAFNPSLGQRITLEEIFDNIGLNKSKYKSLLNSFGFVSFKDELKSDFQREKVKKMLDSIYPEVEEVLQNEKETLLKYLRQSGIFDFQQINVVDVGWRGSTHKAIRDLTGKKVTGYYFGTTDIVYPDISKDVLGYAFNLGKPKQRQNVVMENVMMYEFIFSAPHGSLIKLVDSEGEITPCFKEEDRIEGYLSSIIKGIIKATESYIDYFSYVKNVTVDDCLGDYIEFIEHKNYDDLFQFKELTSSVGIGDTQDKQPFVTFVSLKEYQNRKKEIRIQVQKNLWKNALVVYGTGEDLEKIGIHFRFAFLDRMEWFIRERIIRGIRNPKKAFRYILRKLRK
ncbi:hypothetical protein [Paenibacillus vini]|uniref:Haloacid dehalogenase n=1 Tax=Paenibacillus vini TaxID=1476024 RepID=A0ABQ4MIR4_9BACL|nr:hypothetical protein [Paenibacillus vini]GIP55878.1 hypothetical protein J42TS3_49130 [Paenibacillus vini]